MESQHHKPLEPPSGNLVMICWIAAITLVAIFGPSWVSVLMFGVVIGGPSAARALARKLGLTDRG